MISYWQNIFSVYWILKKQQFTCTFLILINNSSCDPFLGSFNILYFMNNFLKNDIFCCRKTSLSEMLHSCRTSTIFVLQTKLVQLQGEVSVFRSQNLTRFTSFLGLTRIPNELSRNNHPQVKQSHAVQHSLHEWKGKNLLLHKLTVIFSIKSSTNASLRTL